MDCFKVRMFEKGEWALGINIGHSRYTGLYLAFSLFKINFVLQRGGTR